MASNSNYNEKTPTDLQSGVLKVKEERIDPEIEEKINSTICTNSDRNVALFTNGIVFKQECGSRQSSMDTGDVDSNQESVDEKKHIEPVKSSNEILAELFKVFNAAPPEDVLNDESLLKKVNHKKHKKEKKKKRKKSKGDERIKSKRIEPEECDSSASSVGSKGKSSKSKYKKQKKHKHKSEKGDNKKSRREKPSSHKQIKGSDSMDQNKINKEYPNELSSGFSEDISPKNRKRARCSDSHIASSRLRHTDDQRLAGTNLKIPQHNSFYNGFRESKYEHNSDRDRPLKARKPDDRTKQHTDVFKETVVREDYGQVSDISLSDEETYLDEYRVGDRRRTPGNSTCSASLSRDYRHKRLNTFYNGAERTKLKRSRERDRTSYRYRRRTRSRTRSRSRSRSRSHDLGIDKKRLLEIARKNAISMFKRGNLPGCEEMTEEVKDKVLLKMRYGGRTVQDLTEFCKKLSNRDDLNDISGLSSEEESDVDKSGNLKAFNHPFMIKEREPIVFDIRGAGSKKPSQPQENPKKVITMQFPVSSGQQHRLTEAWVPVTEPKDALTPLPALPAATQATSIFKKLPLKNVFEKPVPVETEQEPAFKPVNVAPAADVVNVFGAASSKGTVPLNTAPPNSVTPLDTIAKPIPPPVANQSAAAPTTNTTTTTPFVPDVPVPSADPNLSVFPPTAATNLDVSSIISKRLNAMRRLQDNPMDSEALKMMYSSQQEMSSWASSKHMPGEFTGSTGVNTLSVRELNSGPQAWARRDQLTSTLPVTGGMGMHLLKKMGWRPGEGLGREKSGSLQPLLLDIKLDKRGLVSQEDNGYQPRQGPSKKRRSTTVGQIQQEIKDKHPVSLLNELTSKRKWTPPLYTLVNEGGPSHNKMFFFSVSINGQTFTPNEGSNTKKDAKVKAARFCLQQIGFIP